MLTTTYVQGAPNWLDLGSPDIEAAAAFYGAVFGWELQSMGPEAGGYGFFQLDGKTVAAVGPLTEEGATSSWTPYFQTADADATTKAVEQAGGTVRVPPDDVLTAGRLAAYTDPTGAQFAVWQPGDNKGLDAVTDVNTLTWTELYTTDAAAAKDFYRSVFSWDYEDMPFPGTTYSVVSPAGGGQEATQGGIMQLQKENLDAGSGSEWHPYFEVADVDATFAKAAERGATTLIPPMDAEGVGRIAMFMDPSGAQVAIIRGSDR
ncbi:VOC family protein [Streptomyces lunaelactis]|uniref:VOC family protein n=1 Tax=Streptomyces lunaelactis TaxID=1535768 RepID=UPI001585445D|nr:VOC family protein [Streptomyces lunaelactis]NUJ99904.1 VOC family protein [Streptomyces lunaelactis]NUK17908.1 VOC family protein [Streptomyces lunaelactis]NUK62288.1 VOC family protein [Streptomyces lunaelactis]NUL14295.1 VOC family protein [Streptomyces lunaelactis]NUL27737.1 VOC family protein [Streptomyces lunaelactis]